MATHQPAKLANRVRFPVSGPSLYSLVEKQKALQMPATSKEALERKRTRQKKINKARRLRALEYKGSKCCICGYAVVEALEFHHVNPEEKDHKASLFAQKEWDEVQPELDKCVLVCANCHRLIHFRVISL